MSVWSETVWSAEAGTSETSATIQPPEMRDGLTRWQLTLSSTGTVTIEASNDGTNWSAVTKTASGYFEVPWASHYRSVISANGGTITLIAKGFTP